MTRDNRQFGGATAFEVGSLPPSGYVAWHEWAAAAGATYWTGVAQTLLRAKAVRQLVKAETRRRKRNKADGRKKGTATTRAKSEANRRRARERLKALDAAGPKPQTGRLWTLDEVAASIHTELGVSFATARGYLKGVRKAWPVQAFTPRRLAEFKPSGLYADILTVIVGPYRCARVRVGKRGGPTGVD